MNLSIKISRDDFLHYVAIEGLKKSRLNEEKALNMFYKLVKDEMLTRSTLNNWKGDILHIRYATSPRELKILFDAILTDVGLPENHDERSLLY